jgi:hypothetical protein
MFDPTAVQAASAPPRGPNPFALLTGVWFRPGRTLRAVATGPAWLWAIPFFIALALAVGLALAGAPARDAQQRERSQAMLEARLQELPPELRESPPEGFADLPEPSRVLTLWVPLVIAAAGILLGWLLRAAVLHVSSLALGGRQSFGAVYRTSAWASFPLLLRSAVQLIYLLVGGRMIDGAGLSGLLAAAPAADGGVSLAAPSIPAILLSRVDLYTIWYVILLGVAVAAAGKLSKGKAAVVVAVYVVLSLLTALTQLVTQGLMGGSA